MTIYENLELINSMRKFIAGLSYKLMNFEKVIQVQNFLTMNGEDEDCKEAVALLCNFNSLNLGSVKDICVKKLEEGRDYVLPSSAINGMVIEKTWLCGAVKITNHALNAIGFTTKIDSLSPRKTCGGVHYLRIEG